MNCYGRSTVRDGKSIGGDANGCQGSTAGKSEIAW